MNINWKVRLKNKRFVLTLIPALALLVQAFMTIFGITIDLSEIVKNVVAFINALFVVLAIIGIVNDPTTDGFKDSNKAMTYDKPKQD